MTNPSIAKQSMEAEIRQMSNRGSKLSMIRKRIDYMRSVYGGDSEAEGFLNKLEMQYVIKPLGGLPYAK